MRENLLKMIYKLIPHSWESNLFIRNVRLSINAGTHETFYTFIASKLVQLQR